VNEYEGSKNNIMEINKQKLKHQGQQEGAGQRKGERQTI
jgi:hypothetical protein